MAEKVRGVAALINWLCAQWRKTLPYSPGGEARPTQLPPTVVAQELLD